MANIKLKRPEQNVIEPYTKEELKALLRVCQHDIDNSSPFLGTRNKAIILLFLDSGVRLSELANICVDDIGVQILKSVSAREVFKKFPKLTKQLWAGEFWSEGHFVRSVGHPQLAGGNSLRHTFVIR